MRLFSPLATITLAFAVLLTAGGCAWSQDERDFYGRGWLNPRDLDRPAPYKGTRPIGEGTTEGTPTNPWTTPPPSDSPRQ